MKKHTELRKNHNKKISLPNPIRKNLPAILCVEAIVLMLLVCAAVYTFAPFGDKTHTAAATAAAGNQKTATAEIQNPEMVSLNTSASLTLSFAGDCTLGTDESFNYSTSLNSYYESQGSQYFLKNVKPVFETDDLTIVNLEGPLTTASNRADTLFAFKGDPEFVSILTDGSVEAVTLANNHSYDYGEEGYQETRLVLENAGIASFGYDEVAVIDVKGVRVGLVGIYELFDHLERSQQLKDNIAKVKEQGAQLIVAEFHWGNEKETTPDSNQMTLARLAIDEGAHVVVGHHPHVIQPVETYKGRYIAYSLANFCFGGNSAPSDTDTYIFQQTFTIEEGIVVQDDNVNIVPCSISSEEGYNNYQPTPVEGEEAERILNRVKAGTYII